MIWLLVLGYAVLSALVGLLVGSAIRVREAERPSPAVASPESTRCDEAPNAAARQESVAVG